METRLGLFAILVACGCGGSNPLIVIGDDGADAGPVAEDGSVDSATVAHDPEADVGADVAATSDASGDSATNADSAADVDAWVGLDCLGGATIVSSGQSSTNSTPVGRGGGGSCAGCPVSYAYDSFDALPPANAGECVQSTVHPLSFCCAADVCTTISQFNDCPGAPREKLCGNSVISPSTCVRAGSLEGQPNDGSVGFYSYCCN